MIKYQVLAGVALVAAAGCSGSDGQPSLALTDANAPTVAGEVLVDGGQLGSASALPIGGAAFAGDPGRVIAANARRGLDRVLRTWRAPAGLAPHADPAVACGVSGTSTTTISGGGTSGSGTISFDHCVEIAGVETDGSITFSGSATGSSAKISVTMDLTITTGSLSIAESGGYDLALGAGSSDLTFDLTSSHLELTITVGGTLRDQITLSNVKIHAASDVLGNVSQSLTESYEIDSSRLSGHFKVETMASIMQSGNLYPSSGQLVITGANGSRLVITVTGDETSTPAAGQGQIKLEVDAGSGTLGAAVWTSWAAIAASAST